MATRSKCVNPECINALCPGVKIIGGGKTGAPLFGNGATAKTPKMVWAWVNCLACNPKPKDPAFVLKRRSANDMAQRAQQATEGAPYKPDSAVGARLARVAVKTKSNGSSAPSLPDNSELMAKIDKLMEGQSELLDQIKELRAENRELKEENKRLKAGGVQTVAN